MFGGSEGVRLLHCCLSISRSSNCCVWRHITCTSTVMMCYNTHQIQTMTTVRFCKIYRRAILVLQSERQSVFGLSSSISPASTNIFLCLSLTISAFQIEEGCIPLPPLQVLPEPHIPLRRRICIQCTSS